jgi:Flp pilus assembly protein TadG
MHQTHTSHRTRTGVAAKCDSISAVGRRVVSDAGTSLVEFALVLPVLMMVLVGILSFGRAMNYDEQATHLANEAVRYAAVDSKPTDPATGQPFAGTLGAWVRKQADSAELANSTGSVSGTQVCIAYGPQGTAVGQPVTVTMKFTFSWLPVLKVKVASTTITRTATMRIEAPPTDPFFASGCS